MEIQTQVEHNSKDLPNSKSINATDSLSVLKEYIMTGKILWQAEFLKSLNHSFLRYNTISPNTCFHQSSSCGGTITLQTCSAVPLSSHDKSSQIHFSSTVSGWACRGEESQLRTEESAWCWKNHGAQLARTCEEATRVVSLLSCSKLKSHAQFQCK